MSINDLVAKYINNTVHVFEEIKTATANEVKLDNERVRDVIKYARDYLEDSKYHRDQKKFEVALASVAYCEGLLDALRLIGVVEFQWPTGE
jgi:FAD synthetase